MPPPKSPKKPKGSFFSISWDHNTDRTLRFNEDLDSRAFAATRMMMYAATKELLIGIKSMIPRKDEYKELLDSLKIVEIPGSKKKSAFAVTIDSKARKIKKIDIQRTVLYVRGKKKMDRKSPAITALEDMGPWTPDTIPFWPNKREAVVIQRKVTKREADKISKMQLDTKQKEKVASAFANLPGKKPGKGNKDKVSRNGKAIPDLNMLAHTLEFGGPGQKAVPAWRTTIHNIITMGLSKISKKYKQIDAAFTDPNSREWKKWPRNIEKASLASLGGLGFGKK
jgi:hypothetical protein